MSKCRYRSLGQSMSENGAVVPGKQVSVVTGGGGLMYLSLCS